MQTSEHKKARVVLTHPVGLETDRESLIHSFDKQEPVAHAAILALSVTEKETYLKMPQMTGNVTINATIGSHITAGAIVQVEAKSDGTARSVTFGTGFTSPAMSGTISKTKVARFVYDGSTFKPVAAPFQID